MNDEEELELFTIKSGFFQEIPHPRLIAKAIQRAEVHCGIQAVPDLEHYSLNEHSLEQTLQQYLQLQNALRLDIAQSSGFSGLYINLVRLERLQTSLVEKLASYASPDWLVTFTEIKQSSPIQVYQLLQFIREHQLAENQIMDYLCQLVASGGKDILLLSCLQCLKIVLHGRTSTSA